MNRSDIFNRGDSSNENQIYTVNGRPSFRIQRRPQAQCGIFPLGSVEEMTPLLQEDNHEAMMSDDMEEAGSVVDEPETQRNELPAPTEAANYSEPLPVSSAPPTYVGWSASRPAQFIAPQDAGDNATVRHVRGMQRPGQSAHSLPMYQYMGSNIQRNPLTGSGITEDAPKSGKRMVNKFGYRIID